MDTDETLEEFVVEFTRQVFDLESPALQAWEADFRQRVEGAGRMIDLVCEGASDEVLAIGFHKGAFRKETYHVLMDGRYGQVARRWFRKWLDHRFSYPEPEDLV